MLQKNKTIDHNLLVDFNSSLSTILEDAEHQQHKHQEKGADIEKFKYTGDNSYVTSILTKAHTQFPDEPDLAAIIALMGKEEQEDEIRNAKTAQWIHQTQQKIDQQQQSLGQHSADLQDKEARFRAQDQRFQDFNAQVAAMNLNPVQQAQAAQEFQKNPEQDPEQVLSKYKAPEQPSTPKVKNNTVTVPAPDAPVKPVKKPEEEKKKTKVRVKADKQNDPIKLAQAAEKLAQAANRDTGGFGAALSNANPANEIYYQRTGTGPEESLQESISMELLKIAEANYVKLYQGLVSGAKKVPLEFPNTQVPVALQDWQVRGFWEYLKSMGNAAGKEATIANLLSNPTYLLQWLSENIPSPNQIKKVTRRVPKGQTPDMFNTPPPKAPAATAPTPPQGELFETPNTIEDDLLLEYLVSLNTLLDNASK